VAAKPMIKDKPKHNFKTGIVSLSLELLHNVGCRRSSRPFKALIIPPVPATA
jgi:hypothetical protein